MKRQDMNKNDCLFEYNRFASFFTNPSPAQIFLVKKFVENIFSIICKR